MSPPFDLYSFAYWSFLYLHVRGAPSTYMSVVLLPSTCPWCSLHLHLHCALRGDMSLGPTLKSF